MPEAGPGSRVDRRAAGRRAEDRAAEFLVGLGLTIVTRRFKGRRGELDLVALEGETFVFVEVKARRGRGGPEEAVDKRKMGLLREVGAEYLALAERPEAACRFDLVAVDDAGLRHYPGAFDELWDP